VKGAYAVGKGLNNLSEGVLNFYERTGLDTQLKNQNVSVMLASSEEISSSVEESG
jgi:hypothetical protein